MAVAEAGPNVYVVLDEQEVSVPTAFQFTWVGTRLAGSYTLFVGDIPQHEVLFPGLQEDDVIFLRQAEVVVKRSTKVALIKMPKVKKILEAKKLLGILLPKDHYTVEDLYLLCDRCGGEPVPIFLDVESAIRSKNEKSILRAVRKNRPTMDQILDIYILARDTRSNFLMNLSKALGRIYGDRVK